MSRFAIVFIATTVLLLATSGVAAAQGTAPAAKAPPATGAPVPSKVDLSRLEGAWARPDGGYVILIKKVAADGKLEAMYFNPKPLPFAKAQVAMDGATPRLSFEIQAGGYAGSTYELVYDPAIDRLAGVYYQAVAKQKFDVVFSRK